MSALTKTFVILHVVMSMLLAAGLIVFVNRVDDFQKTSKTTNAQLALEKQRASESLAELATVRAAMQNVQNTAQAQTAQLRNDLAAKEKESLDLRSQIAELQAQAASDKAALASANEALKVAQNNQGIMQGQLTDLRTNHDKLMQQFTEANMSISDLTNRLSVTERERRRLAEEMAALNERNANAGADAARAEAAGSEGRPRVARNVNVNGVVREKRMIAGVPYATISIGSADAVQRGMKLRVLGGKNNQEFLGYVEVTSVEPDEAIGRLTGPRINEITANNQVVSQL